MTHTCDDIFTVLKCLAEGKTLRNPDEITLDMNVLDDLGLDSLTVTDLIIEVEEHFDFEFEEEDLFRIATVDQLVHLIHEKAG